MNKLLVKNSIFVSINFYFYSQYLTFAIPQIEKIKLLETTAKTLEVARDKTRDTIVQLQYDIDAAEANELLQEFVAQSYVANKQAPDKS